MKKTRMLIHRLVSAGLSAAVILGGGTAVLPMLADTAAVVSDIAGITVPCNRISVHLDPGDILYVAQVVGGRLPEGSTTLPEGFKLKFYKATITEGGC